MSLTFSEHVPLHQFTTLQVGGVARWFVEVKSVEELQVALRFAKQTATPLLFLGGGSNVLIPDEGFPGLVVKLALHDISPTETESGVMIRVGAGVELDELVAFSCARGWWGLENLSAIPGTVGATPIQNVGAYGVEVAMLIETVEAIHSLTLEQKVFTANDCQFGYRDSWFKTKVGKQWCITAVTFRLSTTVLPRLHYPDLQSLQSLHEITPNIIREAVIRIRSKKFPDWRQVGTAGSFFKNPILPNSFVHKLLLQYPELPTYEVTKDTTKVSLGWILDKVCGLKGYQVDAVGLYEQQALVLINHGGTANDIKNFVAMIKTKVKTKTDIDIEPEVTFV